MLVLLDLIFCVNLEVFIFDFLWILFLLVVELWWIILVIFGEVNCVVLVLCCVLVWEGVLCGDGLIVCVLLIFE